MACAALFLSANLVIRQLMQEITPNKAKVDSMEYVLGFFQLFPQNWG